MMFWSNNNHKDYVFYVLIKFKRKLITLGSLDILFFLDDFEESLAEPAELINKFFVLSLEVLQLIYFFLSLLV